MKIYIIRHGMTKGNKEHRYVGVTDEELLPEAEEYLACKKMPLVNRVYASPKRRCLQTAALLYPALNPIIIGELAECDFGAFEYCNYQELNGNPDYQHFIDTNGQSGFPNGEDRKSFQARSLRGFEKVLAKEREFGDLQDIALVVHGGTIMAVFDELARPHKDYYDWQVKNGEGFVAEIVWNGNGAGCSLEKVEAIPC